MTTPSLSTDALCVGYGGVPVVRDIALDVNPGEMVALFGANGAGKTTTLLTLAGEIPPVSGRVLLLGDPAPGQLHQRARAGLGLLSDDRSIFMGLTVRENLWLGSGSVDDALTFFPELEEHLGRRAGLLSGGQQQMLALARIFAARPKVILADELSMGLAPLVLRRLLEALRAAADDGAAVLLVEQHVRLALQKIDRLYVLSRQRVALSARAEDVRHRPEIISDLYFAAA
jgi:branched-chain amino acid transport system ATP-binding protein